MKHVVPGDTVVFKSGIISGDIPLTMPKHKLAPWDTNQSVTGWIRSGEPVLVVATNGNQAFLLSHKGWGWIDDRDLVSILE